MKKLAAKYDPGVQINEDDVLCLHRNENLFVPRSWTVEAAQQLVERANLAAYPEATSKALREALAERYGVSPDNVFVGNGSDEVLADLLSLLRLSHDDMHVTDVSFKVYPMLAERMQFGLRTLPGDTFRSGRIDAAGFQGLAVVDSPNAITGVSLPREDVLALAADPGSYLIWDNAYGEYAGDEPPPWQDNVAWVRSFSKFYGLAGLRVGYCIAAAELVAAMLARKDAFNVNSLGQQMALEALHRHQEFVAQRDELMQRRAELTERLQALGFVVHEPAGIAILATHPGYSGEFLQRRLLERKVAVRRFDDAVAANHIRITVAPKPMLDQFMDVLCDIIGD